MEKEVVIDMQVDTNRRLALEMTLKCADIAHGAKSLALHKEWSGMITREFFSQGDKERDLGLPVSPLCDRESVVLSKSQKGFLSFLVLPLFESYETFIGQGIEEEGDHLYKIPVVHIKDNIAFWEAEIDNPTYELAKGPPIAQIAKSFN
jgi:3',5'-cyclic-nucleotide phosphodiesterase/cAMP-specific phosphodiesterase 4